MISIHLQQSILDITLAFYACVFQLHKLLLQNNHLMQPFPKNMATTAYNLCMMSVCKIGSIFELDLHIF